MKEKFGKRLKKWEEYVFNLSDSVIEWAKGYQTLFLMYVVIGVVVFFMLMSQNLCNSMDGLWHNSSFHAGTWERSIGRWAWPYLDKFRFGLVSSSLNSIVTLIFVACGNILIVDLFQMKHRLPAFLAGALFVASPLICDSLSYVYMSATFGLAYFLAVFSVYCAFRITNPVLAIIIGGGALACSMGNYQAYLGVACVIMLVFFINKLFQNENKNEVLLTAIKAICAVLLGGILYEIMVKATCALYNINLASYRGADRVSLGSIIANFPARVVVAYKQFFEFYFSDKTQRLYFHLKDIHVIVFALTAVILVYKMISVFKANIMYGLLSVIAVLLIPLACNAVLLITTTTNSVLMTGGLTLLFPLFLCLFDDFMSRKLFYSFFLLCLICMLWINVCIVNNDQIAMKEGRTSVVTIAENIITRLGDEGYIGKDIDNTFAIVGRPAENAMFAQTAALRKANGYAKFGGDFWSISHGDHGNNRRSWNGLLSEYCGVSLRFCSNDTYADLISTTIVKDMPCFPEEGSIREIDGVVVIKVSDKY